LNISTHNGLLYYWVKQPVCPGFFIIPNKHILLALLFKFGPLLSWNMTISNVVEHFKVKHTRLSSTPDFLWCFLVQFNMWTPIFHIDGALHCFCTELLRHVLASQHCSNHVKNGLILPVANFIFLGRVYCC